METVCSETINFYYATWYDIPRYDIFLKEGVSSVEISRSNIQSFDVEEFQTVIS
jgi:lipocalin